MQCASMTGRKPLRVILLAPLVLLHAPRATKAGAFLTNVEVPVCRSAIDSTHSSPLSFLFSALCDSKLGVHGTAKYGPEGSWVVVSAATLAAATRAGSTTGVTTPLPEVQSVSN